MNLKTKIIHKGAHLQFLPVKIWNGIYTLQNHDSDICSLMKLSFILLQLKVRRNTSNIYPTIKSLEDLFNTIGFTTVDQICTGFAH